MATHSTLSWRIPWTEEPGRLQSMGSQELDMSQRLKRERGRIEPKTPVDFYNVPRGIKRKLYPIQSGNLLGKASMVAQQSRICLQCRRCEFNPWVGKIPWRRKWQTTPVFLPKNSHGQRSLEGYCPRITESDTTEATQYTGTHALKTYMVFCLPGQASSKSCIFRQHNSYFGDQKYGQTKKKILSISSPLTGISQQPAVKQGHKTRSRQ